MRAASNENQNANLQCSQHLEFAKKKHTHMSKLRTGKIVGTRKEHQCTLLQNCPKEQPWSKLPCLHKLLRTRTGSMWLLHERQQWKNNTRKMKQTAPTKKRWLNWLVIQIFMAGPERHGHFSVMGWSERWLRRVVTGFAVCAVKWTCTPSWAKDGNIKGCFAWCNSLQNNKLKWGKTASAVSIKKVTSTTS